MQSNPFCLCSLPLAPQSPDLDLCSKAIIAIYMFVYLFTVCTPPHTHQLQRGRGCSVDCMEGTRVQTSRNSGQLRDHAQQGEEEGGVGLAS